MRRLGTLSILVAVLLPLGVLAEEPPDLTFGDITYRLHVPDEGPTRSLLAIVAPLGLDEVPDYPIQYILPFTARGIAVLVPRSRLDRQTEPFAQLLRKTAKELEVPTRRTHLLAIARQPNMRTGTSSGPVAQPFALERLLATGKLEVGTVALGNTDWRRGGSRLKRSVSRALLLGGSPSNANQWVSPEIRKDLPGLAWLPAAFLRTEFYPEFFSTAGEDPDTHWTIFYGFWLRTREGDYLPKEDLHFSWIDGPEEGRKALGASRGGGLVYFYSLKDAEKETALTVQNDLLIDADVQRLLLSVPRVRIEREEHEEMFLSLLLKKTPALVLMDKEFQVLRAHQGKIRRKDLVKDLEAFAAGELR